MVQALYRLFIELTNGKWSSKLLKRFTTSKWSRLFIRSYAKVYQINQDEMDQSLKNYQTLHDLFTRKLKQNARQIDTSAKSVISPVDAVLADMGEVLPTKDVVIKGKVYSLAEMFADEECIRKYIHGTYIIFYLSPRDYHRIHSPLSGTVINEWTLGNKSYPVNRLGLKYGNSPLTKNYRTITEVKHPYGHVVIVKVGAMFINSIEKTYAGEQLVKGMEMAYFTFGSTVILLFEKNTFQLAPKIKTKMSIKMGEKIGELIE